MKSLFEEDGKTENSNEKLTESTYPIITKEESIQMSGAFFIRGGETLAFINLEFRVEHPKFKVYLNRLKDFVEECKEAKVISSYSGL